MIRQLSFLTCYVSFLLGHGLLATVIYVDDDASTGGDGTSWSTAHKHLQDALAVAEYGDEIWVAEGTYKPDQGAGKTAGDRTSPFVLVNGVGMYGGFLGTENSRDPKGDNNQTILSGEISDDSELWSLNIVSGQNLDANTTLDGFRITKGNANGENGTVYQDGGGLWVKDSEFRISNCVFTNNSASNDGGGIYSSYSYLTLNNCVFTNNSVSGEGGGIFSSSSSLTLNNCVFTNNSASQYGGGGINSKWSSLTLTNCVFTNNKGAVRGGGIESFSSSATLTNCIFTNNSTERMGGGIYSSSSTTLTFTNCVFTNNSAWEGGGIFSSSSTTTTTLTFTNCVFTNNSATMSSGGGIFSSSSSLTLINCIFANNSAVSEGGGISFSSSFSLILANSIFWKNHSDDATGHGLRDTDDSLISIVLQESIEAGYPGDPNARDTVYEPNLNILQGWEGDARAFDAEPLFVDIDNPAGPDGIWFTEDDGLRVISGSPAIDAGYKDALPSDSSDLDGDGNVTEPIPYDALRRSRVIGSRVDIGPYEFDPDNPPPAVKTRLTFSTTTGGTVTGGGDYEKEVTATIEAVPSSGYLFSTWSGDASGSSNPLTVTMDTDKSITANFIQDSNDNDGDGLTNYQELVTFGTNPNKQDSDKDGILDKEEIDIGTNPNDSDKSIVEFLLDTGNRDKLLENLANAALEDARSEKFNLHFETPITVTTLSASSGSFSADLKITKGGSSRVRPQFYVKSALSPNYESYFGNDSIKLGQAQINAMTYNVRAENLEPDTYFIARAMIRDTNARIHAVGDPILFKTSPVPSYSESDLSSSKEAGKSLVTSNPASYSLVTQSAYNQALLDANESAEKAIADAKVSAKAEGITEGKASVTNDPASYSLVTQSAYNQAIESAKKTAREEASKDFQDIFQSQDSNSSPYTPDWFYIPKRGWMWTDKKVFPWFHDANSSNWMYFKSGQDKPTFYHNGTKEWMTLE